MNQHQNTILVVDDEPINLMIINEYLESADADYLWETAEDGLAAWEMLERNPFKYSAVLLDRMMPRMGGMEVLSLIKKHPDMRNLPVILQTARTSKEDIEEGIKAGAYYYLTKPFEEEALISIVRTAINDYQRFTSIQKELKDSLSILGLMQSSCFRFKTLDEARNLSTVLAQTCPNPELTITGLVELMVNAVEHGNLGISYDEKGKLNHAGNWESEVNRLLKQPELKDKYVEVNLERVDGEIHISITDQGDGFDCKPYLEISAERGADNHGRGIALARMLSFERVEYQGKGNIVLAVILDSPAHEAVN